MAGSDGGSEPAAKKLKSDPSLASKPADADAAEDDDDSIPLYKPMKKSKRSGAECPYLDTIHRTNLDFDFEKLCSVSLSNLNVYACLVCGKYFQGRAYGSHAYTHSVHEGHHMFIKLKTEQVSPRCVLLPSRSI